MTLGADRIHFEGANGYAYSIAIVPYERCEECGHPIALGEMPPGPYPVVKIQCHAKVEREGRRVRCGHFNAFPRK